MMDDSDVIVELLRDILGDEKQHYQNKCQIAFNCPDCDDNRGKGNLEINYCSHVYKCWSCGESNEMMGSLGKLIDKYGTKKQKKLYNLVRPEEEKVKIIKKPKVVLPESFTLFKESSSVYPIRRQAYNYLISRGITDDIIDKYGIGFCDRGSHSGRIVVPSYNSDGELNYYVARSWSPKTKSKYKNPEAEKSKIIFNENLINWEDDIFLVEGVFDGFFLNNSIPLLGKFLNETLFDKIYEKSKGFITIALDGDAWEDSKKIYNELNGGNLFGRIKVVKLPQDKDICDLRGKIDEYYYNMK